MDVKRGQVSMRIVWWLLALAVGFTAFGIMIFQKEKTVEYLAKAGNYLRFGGLA